MESTRVDGRAWSTLVDPTGICSRRVVGFCWARWNDVSFTSKIITSSPLLTRWSPMSTSWRVGGACAVVRHCTRSQTPLICRSLPRLPFLIPASARTPQHPIRVHLTASRVADYGRLVLILVASDARAHWSGPGLTSRLDSPETSDHEHVSVARTRRNVASRDFAGF